MRMRAVSSHPLERHVESVRRRGHGVRVPAHGAGGKLRPIMKTENGIGLGIVECARFQHCPGAGEHFLGGLENEHHVTAKMLALFG